jgi:putative flippase GtrA
LLARARFASIFASAMPTPPRRGLTALLRCAGSSALSVGVEFVVLTLLVSVLHVAYLVGSLLSGAAYFVLNFALNRSWAFRAGSARLWPQLFRHGLVGAGGTLLCTPLLWLLVDRAKMPYQPAWILACVIAFLAWTFPMHRWFTYRGAVGDAA